MNKCNRITGLRHEWEALPSEQLEALLHEELEKPVPDDDAVLTLLHILEEREPDVPASLTPREMQAWQKYQTRALRRAKKTWYPIRWLSVAVSLILIVSVMFSLLPQQAEAETLWEMLSRWTESVLEFLHPVEDHITEEYDFQTDHPGLQQVYDAVVEQGITGPVVPMWIPEEYELIELDVINTPKLSGVYADFTDGERHLVYKADIYEDLAYREIYKDHTHSEVYEIDGTTYSIAKNKELWVAVWNKENIECLIALDCQEETLRRILDSIYTMEDN